MRGDGASTKAITEALDVTAFRVTHWLSEPAPTVPDAYRATDLGGDPLCRRFMGVEFMPTHRGEAADAIRVCSWCPVRQACAQAALDLDEVGVWGGVWIPERPDRRQQAHDALRAVVAGEVAA